MNGHWVNNRYLADFEWCATVGQTINKQWLVSTWNNGERSWVIRDVAYDTVDEAKAVAEALVAMK